MTLIFHGLSWAWAHPLDIAIWALLVPSLAFVLGGCGLAGYLGWRWVRLHVARGL